MNSQQNQEIALIGETTTFTRVASKDGELMEIKLHVRGRTAVGVGHESIQTIVLGAEQSAAIIAGLKMLQGQVQAIVSAEQARQAEVTGQDDVKAAETAASND